MKFVPFRNQLINLDHVVRLQVIESHPLQLRITYSVPVREPGQGTPHDEYITLNSEDEAHVLWLQCQDKDYV